MDKRTLFLMAKIIGVYLVLCVPLIIWPSLLDNIFGFVIAIPPISIYIFDAIGVPGMLENSGNCGWGWCGPTVFGIAATGVFWLVMVWLLARFIVYVTAPAEQEEEKPE